MRKRPFRCTTSAWQASPGRRAEARGVLGCARAQLTRQSAGKTIDRLRFQNAAHKTQLEQHRVAAAATHEQYARQVSCTQGSLPPSTPTRTHLSTHLLM